MAREDGCGKPVFDLWVRAGADQTRLGGCPACQQIFMILLLKTQDGHVDFNVKTTRAHKPNAEMNLHRLPALIHDGDVLDVLDEICDRIDQVCPLPDINVDNEMAMKSVGELFSKFCFCIKGVSKDVAHLEAELIKLNAYLTQSESKYLCGDSMSRLDCSIMPTLHHVRLAAGYFRNFQIPQSLTMLWRYLDNAYQCPTFVNSCPCDQEILLHWAQRPDTPDISPCELKRLSKSEPVFSLSIHPS